MSDISKRINSLSPEKRALLALHLKSKGGGFNSFPLSFAQERLWFLDQLDPGSSVYNVPMAVRVIGNLDLAALEKTLREIIRRHEILRTTFLTIDGEPVQVIAPPGNAVLQVTDLQNYLDGRREQEALRLAIEEARRPFDLGKGPLARASLLKLIESEHVILLTMHHIVSDGVSCQIFIREIATLYDAYSKGNPSPLAEPAIQYADFAVWQRQWLQGEVMEQQLGYWMRRLGGDLPVLELPTDRPRPAVQTFRGATRFLELPATLNQTLKELSRQEGATLFMTLLAAFNVLLRRYTNQSDLLIGTPISNRNRRETEGSIGLFVNTLVIRTDISGNPTFRQLLRRVRKIALEAYAHQDLPFEKVVQFAQKERSLSYSPVFQVMFTLTTGQAQTVQLPGLTLRMLNLETGVTHFDLQLVMQEEERSLAAMFEYNADLFDASTIDRMLNHLRTILEAIAADADQRLSDLPLVSERERRRLLREWSQTTSRPLEERCFHELFEQQVKRAPDAIAVTCGQAQLSYQELNRRANQLGRFLQRLGVGPDVAVGVCARRSIQMLVGLIGALKAGGAYVPLDPSYPKEYLSLLFNDAEIPVLLTEQRLIEVLPSHKAKVVYLDSDWLDSDWLDSDWKTISCEDDGNPKSSVTLENLCYLIYTSGSTGAPKGVMIPHRALLNYLSWCAQAYRVAEGRGTPVHSSIGFDLTITGLFPSLLAGRTVTLIDDEEGGLALAEALRRGGDFSLVKITPAHLEILSQLLPQEEVSGKTRAFIIGGETLIGESLDFWIEHAPDTRLINEYGPTETTVGCCVYEVEPRKHISGPAPIGRPIANTQLYVLDELFRPVPIGVKGELYIGGSGLARGYRGRPAITADKFIPHPFAEKPGERLYKTGDLARYMPDGNLLFLGRNDDQIKIRGFRIEPGEIESVLCQHSAVQEAVVIAKEDGPGNKKLIAYLVFNHRQPATVTEMRNYLKERLPDYKLPSSLVVIDELPLTQNGKLDKHALPEPDGTWRRTENEYVAPETEIEKIIVKIWKETLQVEKAGVNDSFFDLGGNSLLVVRVHSKLRERFSQELSIIDLFRYPTIASLAAYLGQEQEEQWEANAGSVAISGRGRTDQEKSRDIAIIGMAGRFPGARNINEFWRNLRDGVESVSFFSDEELLASGIASSLLANPNYVRAGAVLEDIDLFDAAFFGFNPKDASLTDPQQRIFLECAWEALENAGYDSGTFRGRIGIYAGAKISMYLANLYANPAVLESADSFQALLGNDKDHLPTRVSYKLNLKGPSIAVQTTCSTSLVAVHLACQSLLSGECEMSLAGGVSVNVPQKAGAIHQEGGIGSPDGHCRAFDARAKGTVAGNGVGIVVLKRLKQAIDDRDHIYAVIKGSAINNDGSLKIGYTAPSVDGQATVIREALDVAGVGSETINYIEAHGTGTELGDPIEVAALTRAFRGGTDKKGFCAIGSVKTNIGHLDAAAGIAGMIKTALALKHKQIPPSLHFEQPNPKIDFDDSPFFVNSRLAKWERGASPRRAGVSSFGLGGTNVHLVVEEAPLFQVGEPSRPYHLLLLSAKTGGALEKASANLADHLRDNPGDEIADVAHTLQVGRKAFSHRRAVVCSGLDDALSALGAADTKRLSVTVQDASRRPVAFLFPGQGAQYTDMTRGIYESEKLFRDQVDLCSQLLRQYLGLDLREALFPDARKAPEAAKLLNQTWVTQPALFVVEYALARLWMEWGVQPCAMLGHSIGEYVAACLAGVFSIEDGLRLVATRGRLMQSLPAGAMLAVAMGETELGPLLSDELSLAAVNGLSRCVVSGAINAVNELELELTKKGVSGTRLHTSHAFHSKMMEPALRAFIEEVSKISLKPPSLKFISNVSGTWIRDEEATDPHYWAGHLRHTVRFGDGMAELLRNPDAVLLEVGPGRTLSALTRQNGHNGSKRITLGSVRHPDEPGPDAKFLLESLRRLWLAGVEIAWSRYHGQQPRRRLPLPPYPFERQRFWIEKQRYDDRQSLDERNGAGPVAAVSEQLPLFPPAIESHARPNLAVTYERPGNDVERTLVEIWERALGIAGLGIADNFFELGGDSVICIQVVAKASQAGLQISPKHIFEYPTIKELSTFVETVSVVEAEQGLVIGPLPLTPIQRWFFDSHTADLHHYNQALLLETRRKLDSARVNKVIEQLLLHHDALRLRFVMRDADWPDADWPDADWRQFNAGDDQAIRLEQIDLSGIPENGQVTAIERKAAEMQLSLDLTDGPLIRVGLFDLGEGRPGRLLLVIHHLAIDGLSWRVLLEDLQRGYEQSGAGESIQFPHKTTSFKRWAERLKQYAESEDLSREAVYWLDERRERIKHLPTDFSRGNNTSGSGRVVNVSLNAEQTRALLQDVPPAYNTQINDALLAALAQSFRSWTGESLLLIDMEGHGREEVTDGVNVSRTVGWFTTIYPVLLDLADDSDHVEALKRVKEQLRKIPNHGIGYGLLRYMSGKDHVVRALQALPQSEVNFLYLGQLDQVFDDQAPFRAARESTGESRSARGNRHYLFEISGMVTDGRLRISWIYSKNAHRRETVEKLAGNFIRTLQAIIEHCQSPAAGGYTPSDFPMARLDEQRLSGLLQRVEFEVDGLEEY